VVLGEKFDARGPAIALGLRLLHGRHLVVVRLRGAAASEVAAAVSKLSLPRGGPLAVLLALVPRYRHRRAVGARKYARALRLPLRQERVALRPLRGEDRARRVAARDDVGDL